MMQIRQHIPAFLAATLGLLFACSDGDRHLLGPSGRPALLTMALTYAPSAGAEATLPINLARATAYLAGTSDALATAEAAVDPDGTGDITLGLSIPIPAGTSVTVRITVELIHVDGSGTPLVQWSGEQGPYDITTTTPTNIPNFEVFPGPLDNLLLEALTVTPAAATLDEGETLALSAAFDPPDLEPVIFWRSLDAAIASVTADGVVQALLPGTARIEVAAGKVADTATVTVLGIPAGVQVEPAAAAFAALGEELVLAAAVVDARGDPIPGATVEWSVADASIVEHLGGGRFAARARGATVITAAMVGRPDVAQDVPATVEQVGAAIEITTQPADVEVGRPITVAAALHDALGSVLEDDDATEVSVAIATGTGTPGATLGGTTTRAVAAGVVAFDDLTIDSPGTGYRLALSAAGVPETVTNTFVVSELAPADVVHLSADPAVPPAGSVVVGSVAEAVARVAAGGQVLIYDGTYDMEDVLVSKPVTFEAAAGASPLLRAIELDDDPATNGGFIIGGIATGTVAFRNLAFEAVDRFDVIRVLPDGYDQVVIEGCSLTLTQTGEAAVHGVVVSASAAANARVTVAGSSFSGGAIGVWSVGGPTHVLQSTFTNQSFSGIELHGPGRAAGNTLGNCAVNGCIRVSDPLDAVITGNHVSNTAGRSVVSGIVAFTVDASAPLAAGRPARTRTAGVAPALRNATTTHAPFTGTPTPPPSPPTAMRAAAGAVTAAAQPFHATIEDNIVQGVGTTGTNYAFDGPGIWVYRADATVRGNGVGDALVGINFFAAQTAVIEGNTVDPCGHWCISVDHTGQDVRVADNVVRGRRTRETRYGILGQWREGSGTLLIEGNDVLGMDAPQDPAAIDDYAIHFGVSVIAWLPHEIGTGQPRGEAVTVRDNLVRNAARGVTAYQGGVLRGQDNRIESAHTAWESFDGGDLVDNHSDATGYRVAFDGGRRVPEGEPATMDVTCNWWGSAAGPQNIGSDPDLTAEYVPWATEPVAGTASTSCDGGPLGPVEPEPHVLVTGSTSQAQHFCGLRADGTAVCWGDNTFGQLGVGDPEIPFSAEPVPVSGGHTFVTMASGVNHVCGVRTDGLAYCWGNNVQAQLGAGTGPHQFAPVPVAGGVRFTTLSADGNSTCGIDEDGAAHCWGNNDSGQLGTGVVGGVETQPAAVVGGHTFAAVAGGSNFSCALTPAGETFCWGRNQEGQLGTGATGAAQPTPQAAAAGHVFRTIAAGTNVACALDAAGRAWCWGTGTLGDGVSISSSSATPLEVVGGHAFAQLRVATGIVCGVTLANEAHCWGGNGVGQLGTGDFVSRAAPTAVAGGSGFVAVTPNAIGTCGITATGEGYCWGQARAGFLANGEVDALSGTPIRVLGGHSFRLVTAGSFFTCGLDVGDGAHCWGIGSALGDGQGSTSYTPVTVAGGLAFDTIAAGGSHTCGLTADGAAYCWGGNAQGQIGDGTTTTRVAPVPVAGGHVFRSIHPGQISTCGLTFDGELFCWGHNGFGQYGDGTTTSSLEPVPAAGGMAFRTVSGLSQTHMCGIDFEDEAYCWGQNHAGQAGDGTLSPRLSPVPVAGGHVFAAIVAGGSGGPYTCALTFDGAAYCWGRNTSGELGDGTGTDQSTPVAVAGGHTFTDLSPGLFTACGITDPRATLCWGNRRSGMFGDDRYNSISLVPAPAADGLTLAAVAVGNGHACGIAAADAAYCWGSNASGALGGLEPIFHAAPVSMLGGHVFMRP